MKEEIEDEKIQNQSAPKATTRRQILIETDGNNVFLVKAEVNGRIELTGILNTLVAYLNSQK